MTSQPQTFERALPHNAQAEEAALGAILINADALHDVLDVMGPEDCYIVRNEFVLRAMADLAERHEAIDYVTVLDELERRHQLAEIGGPAYLSRLVNMVPTAVNAGAYARVVAQLAVRRRLAAAAQRIVQDALDDDMDADDALSRAMDYVQVVADARRGDDDTVPFHDAAHEVWVEAGEWRDNPLQPGQTRGLPWGLIDLDAATLGFLPGEYVIVCGRPGMGKSSLAMQGGNYLTTRYDPRLGRNYHTLIFSLEMRRRQVFRREACALARLDYRRLKTGHIEDDEWQRFTDAQAQIARREGWIRTRSATIADIERIIKRYHMRYGVDQVIVDHLGKVAVPGVLKEYDAQSIVSNRLAQIGHDLGIVVVAVCQLNRDVEKRQDKRPTMADLRASGHIEEDADWVLGLYRPAYYDHALADTDKTAMVYLLKTRDDGPADITLIFEPSQTRFDNAETHSTAEFTY